MADCLHSTDPPPSIFSCSPKIATPVKTLDEEASPTAPIRALVAQSLALSSPNGQNQNQASPPAKSLTQIQNPDESSPSSRSNKTLVTPSPAKIEENERRDSRIMLLAQISPSDNSNNRILHIASTSYSPEFNRDSYNRPPRRYLANPDYQSDDDFKIEPTKPVVEVSWSSPKIEPTGVGAGLDNSGNTCFIASVLQCFTHTVPLLESLRSYKYKNPCNCGSENFCVLQTLRDHIELALRSSGYSLSTDRFRNNLNYFSPDFQINNQEDAHEFLQSFLDKLERCCLDPRNKPGSISSQDVNIVDHVFGGRLVSRLHCCNCNSFSDTFEPSLGLSLEIEDVDNLWSALESFTRVEKLEDQFMCDNCKEKVSKEKQLKLDKLPLVATFHLKRFKNDGLTMQKIFNQVEFPLELDLLPYMSSNHDPDVSTKYHLYAMVEHIGNGVSFGHYSSYVRSAHETWHSFDDSKVTRVREDYVLSQNAYILFYAREGTPWFSTAFEELKPLFDATPLNASPKSVLETTCREECVSDHSYENVCNSNKASVGVASIPQVNYPDFRCQEPQEEVFHSATESGSDDDSSAMEALESPKADESEKLFAETSRQREPETSPAGNKATINDNTYVPVHKTQNQDSSPKRKADERVIIGDSYQPKLKIQKPDSFPKRQGSFKIQREHLPIKKKKEETRGTKPLRSIVTCASADPKDKEIARSYLNKYPNNARSRMLAAALDQSSPIKKKQISNNRRSPMGLHRHL